MAISWIWTNYISVCIHPNSQVKKFRARLAHARTRSHTAAHKITQRATHRARHTEGITQHISIHNHRNYSHTAHLDSQSQTLLTHSTSRSRITDFTHTQHVTIHNHRRYSHTAHLDPQSQTLLTHSTSRSTITDITLTQHVSIHNHRHYSHTAHLDPQSQTLLTQSQTLLTHSTSRFTITDITLTQHVSVHNHRHYSLSFIWCVAASLPTFASEVSFSRIIIFVSRIFSLSWYTSDSRALISLSCFTAAIWKIALGGNAFHGILRRSHSKTTGHGQIRFVKLDTSV